MRRRRWIALLVLGLLAGCGTSVTGMPTSDPASGQQPGLLVTMDIGSGGDQDVLKLLDGTGKVRRTIPMAGEAAAGRDLGDGKVLIEVGATLTIIDTRSGTATPVTFDHPDRAQRLEPRGTVLVSAVSRAGEYLLLGEPSGGNVGLVNVRTAQGVSLDGLLDSTFINSASLDPSGGWVTVVSDKGVAVVPTSDPHQLKRILPDRQVAFGTISRDGSRFLAMVGKPGTGPMQIFAGTPDGPITDTGRHASWAYPLSGDRMFLTDGRSAPVIVGSDGTETRLDGLGAEPRIVTDNAGYVLVAGSDHTLQVRLDDPVVIAPQQQDLSKMSPAAGPGTTGATAVLRPQSPKASTELLVVEVTGVRTISGLAPFDSASVLQLSTDKVLLSDIRRQTFQVVDLPTGKPLSRVDGSYGAVAPNASAVVVVNKSTSSIVPVDGSAPVELGAVAVLAWATI